MFNIGDKVMIQNHSEMIGRIVEIAIDPLEEEDTNFEKKYPFYKVRVWRDLWLDGYFDFSMTENDLKLIAHE